MKRKILITIFAAIIITGIFNSCKKTSNEVRQIYVAPALVVHAVQPGNISGAISGTMTTGNTYTVLADSAVIIPKGDTLWLQPGVTVCMNTNATIIVQGALISLGTQAQPNWFTVCNLSKINTPQMGETPASDPAWNGGAGSWTGINCDTSCTLLVLKWTHIEFTGGKFPVAEPFAGGGYGKTSYGILFQNPLGDFVMEDCWMYGGVDDAVRVENGRCCLMRNTFEKMGYTGGDNINCKSGSVGDIAFNLFVGEATNASKASNKGTSSPECNINMYNNTYINCGYRNISTGVGGSIDYEQGARGLAYNNLIVNCQFGIRVLCSPIADTANMSYTSNYAYGDNTAVCDQFFPVGYITRPTAYVIPAPGTTNYIYAPSTCSSVGYDASPLAGQNNPLFLNFPLPEAVSHLYDISYVTPGTIPPLTPTGGPGSYNFQLQSTSPAIGKGYTNFNPNNSISVGVQTLLSQPQINAPIVVTSPATDIGCYPFLGGGNLH